MKSDNTAVKPERKTIEKNRRIIMKQLCSELSSGIQKHASTSKVAWTQADLLHEATSYIKKLKERVEMLKEQKQEIEKRKKRNRRDATSDGMVREIAPMVLVRCQESRMEVVLISGLNKKILFHEVLGVLEEEGAQIVSANLFTSGKEIFHIIHSQAISSRIGFEETSITKRLGELIY